MLGQSMGTPRLYEPLREVQKHLEGGGGGGLHPQKSFGIVQPPRSGSEAIR